MKIVGSIFELYSLSCNLSSLYSVSALCAITTKILNVITTCSVIYLLCVSEHVSEHRPARMYPHPILLIVFSNVNRYSAPNLNRYIPCPVAGTFKLFVSHSNETGIHSSGTTLYVVIYAYDDFPRISETMHATKSHNSNITITIR